MTAILKQNGLSMQLHYNKNSQCFT